MLKILYTLVGGPLNCEALGFSLSSLYVNSALPLIKKHLPHPFSQFEIRNIFVVSVIKVSTCSLIIVYRVFLLSQTCNITVWITLKKYGYQGRIQDFALGGTKVGEGSGDRLRPPPPEAPGIWAYRKLFRQQFWSI
jgi:hypothetical protein